VGKEIGADARAVVWLRGFHDHRRSRSIIGAACRAD